MGKYKDKLLSDFYNSKIKIGETGYVKASFLTLNSLGKNIPVIVNKIEGNNLYVETTYYHGVTSAIIDIKDFNRSQRHIGANPIPDKDWFARINFLEYNIDSLLYACGIETRNFTTKFDKINGVEVPEMNFNPFVYDKNNKQIFYQRPLIWTLEEKQNLINSIYNNAFCGTIVVRERPYSFVENLIKENKNNSIGFLTVH